MSAPRCRCCRNRWLLSADTVLRAASEGRAHVEYWIDTAIEHATRVCLLCQREFVGVLAGLLLLERELERERLA